MDSVNHDIEQEREKFHEMIVSVPENERRLINREIEEEFSRSLNGYSLSKGQSSHLRNIDPKELFDITGSIRRQLSANHDFYLQGDYQLY